MGRRTVGNLEADKVSREGGIVKMSDQVKCISCRGGNIVLAGLQFDDNLGDQIIFSVTREMIKECLQENGITNLEIREMDITGRDSQNSNTLLTKLLRTPNYLMILRGLYKLRKSGKTKELIIYERSKLIAKAECEENIDANTKAIVFAGGGLIKFHYQELDYYIRTITEYADKNNIPVMFSAVGVEGYDNKIDRCMKLKYSLHRKCVKFISTRDDVHLLQNNYEIDAEKIAKVADPACLSQRYFKAKSKDASRNLIGLGLARDGLFKDYGSNYERKKLMKLWADIYNSLIERGYECRFFCNGARSDFNFILDWLDYMSFSQEERELLCLPRPLSGKELIDEICTFKAIIATRLHASIVAYAYDIPSIGIVWNNKQRFFGEAIGYPERFIDVEDLSAETIIARLKKSLDEGYQRVNKDEFCATTKKCINQFFAEYIRS